jgi:hypothetical protein
MKVAEKLSETLFWDVDIKNLIMKKVNILLLGEF